MGNKKRNSSPNESNEREEGRLNNSKKPFDKKTYRLKKYSNKFKVDQWNERRKKAVIRRFYKDIRQEQGRAENRGGGGGESSQEGENEGSSLITNKKGAYHAAEKMYQKLKVEKEKIKEARLIKQKEKTDALNKYKAEKASKYKKLCKKTRKGQPVMKDRLEMLLEKIKQTS